MTFEPKNTNEYNAMTVQTDGAFDLDDTEMR